MLTFLILNLLLLNHVSATEVDEKKDITTEDDDKKDITTEFPTDPPVVMMQCYKCDSKEGACSDQEFGVAGDCPKEYGCSISKGDNVMLRGCGNGNDDFKCAITD